MKRTTKAWMLAALLLGTALTGCRRQGAQGGDSPAGISDTTEVSTPVDYAGVYLDDQGTQQELIITPDSTGGYRVTISIFRLAYLDDGTGKPTSDGLSFTATDPAGRPIGGLITVRADTATVTFTDSRWDYLPNGEQFRYIRSLKSAEPTPAQEAGTASGDSVL